MIAPKAKQKLDKLSIRVLAAPAEALKKEKCPECGLSLKLVFDAAGPRRGSVCIMCPPCQIKIWIDGVAEAPPWVATLGAAVET